MAKEYAGNRQFLRRKLEQIYAGYGAPPERTYSAEELAHISMYYQKHPVSWPSWRHREQSHQLDWFTSAFGQVQGFLVL